MSFLKFFKCLDFRIIILVRRETNILIIKCAKCKSKIMKYKKIGQGKVLRCWESKIRKLYGEIKDEKLFCSNCDNLIGEIRSKGQRNYVKMNRDQFAYSGTKIRK